MKLFSQINKNNYIFFSILFIIIVFVVTFSPLKIKGPSMEPTLKESSWVIVNKLYYVIKKPSRGDIIVFTLPGTKEKFVKRIIALEGETIEIKRGKVFINNLLIKEPYIKKYDNYSFKKRLIPLKTIFVLGDNRELSKDSRYDDFGFISLENVVGKVVSINMNKW